MRFLIILVALLLVTSCDSQEKQTSSEDSVELLGKIKVTEDSIKTLSIDMRPGQRIPAEMSQELVDLLLEFYHSYPKDASAPLCLDKIHMIYSAKREYQMSANYGDSLLNNYPDYVNRPMILESMATTYDIFIEPRDTKKVRYYNELLLKEDQSMSQEKREEILFKLDHLDLTLEEMIKEINE